MENKKIKFILASASPRRKELISYLNIPFIITSKNIPEESHFSNPVEYSQHISEQKGFAVFEHLTEDSFVVSADTIVCLGDKIYGKPGIRPYLILPTTTIVEATGKTDALGCI
jgi:septum formation protein